MTVLFASAVPVSVGVVSEVCVPSAGEVITGAAGSMVSIVTSTWFEAPLVFDGSVGRGGGEAVRAVGQRRGRA